VTQGRPVAQICAGATLRLRESSAEAPSPVLRACGPSMPERPLGYNDARRVVREICGAAGNFWRGGAGRAGAGESKLWGRHPGACAPAVSPVTLAVVRGDGAWRPRGRGCSGFRKWPTYRSALCAVPDVALRGCPERVQARGALLNKSLWQRRPMAGDMGRARVRGRQLRRCPCKAETPGRGPRVSD
jgi:hypothetical protein